MTSAAKDTKPLPKCKSMTPAQKKVLFDKYIVPNLNSIKTLTMRYTDHRKDVDENYNYCLAQLYNYIGSYDPNAKLDTWLHVCVKRHCFYQNRKRAEENSYMTDIEMCSEGDVYGPADFMADAEYGALIDNIPDHMYDVLMKIPPERLSPFLLHAQGLRIREIVASEWQAGHLEKRSEDLVKSRIYWAKIELQFLLREYGIEGTNYKSALNDRIGHKAHGSSDVPVHRQRRHRSVS